MIIIFYEKHFFLLLYVIKVYCQTQAALDVAICFYQNFLVYFNILFNSKNEPKTTRVIVT